MAKARLEATVGLNTGSFRRALARIRRGVMRLRSLARGLQRGFSGILNVIGRLGRIARTAFIAIGAAIGFATRHANQFRSQMAQVNTILGTAKIDVFSKEVRQLSAELGIAKEVLTLGLYQALSSGVPGKNALEFLTETAKASIGGITELKDVVEATARVMDSFGDEAGSATDILDVMQTIVNKGVVFFDQIAGKIGTVAGVAAEAGVKWKEMAAIIATASKTVPVEQLFTGLRAAILAVTAGTEEVDKLFGGTGQAEAFVQAKGLTAAFNKISEAAGGSLQNMKKLIPNVRALPLILAVSGDNAGKVAENIRAMEDSAGAAFAAFRKMDIVRTWPKLWQAVLSIVTRVGDAIDRTLAPAVRFITDLLKNLAESQAFNAFLDRLKEAANFVAGIGAALLGGDNIERTLALRGFKRIIVGAFLLAAEKLIKLILSAGPAIGNAIAIGFKAGLKKVAGGREIRKEAARRGISVEALQAELRESGLQAEGSRLAKKFGLVGREAGRSPEDLIKLGIENLKDAAAIAQEFQLKGFREAADEAGGKIGDIVEKLGAGGGAVPGVAGGAGGAIQTNVTALRKIGGDIMFGPQFQEREIAKAQLHQLELIKEAAKDTVEAIEDLDLTPVGGTFS